MTHMWARDTQVHEVTSAKPWGTCLAIDPGDMGGWSLIPYPMSLIVLGPWWSVGPCSSDYLAEQTLKCQRKPLGWGEEESHGQESKVTEHHGCGSAKGLWGRNSTVAQVRGEGS